jgi:hypothetical protein
MLRNTLTIAAMTGVCLTAFAQNNIRLSSQQAETIELHFGWTPGIHAHVRSFHAAIGSSPELIGSAYVTYELRSEATADGLLIRVENLADSRPEPTSAVRLNMLLAQANGMILQSMRISPNGEFVGLADSDGFLRKVRDVTALVPPQADKSILAARALLANPSRMSDLARHGWTVMVDAWRNRLVTIGTTVETPLVGEEIDPAKYRALTTAQRLLPCPDSKQLRMCVELTYVVAIRDIDQAAGMVAGPSALIEFHYSIITDIATLLPYRIRYRVVQMAAGPTPSSPVRYLVDTIFSYD